MPHQHNVPWTSVDDVGDGVGDALPGPLEWFPPSKSRDVRVLQAAADGVREDVLVLNEGAPRGFP